MQGYTKIFIHDSCLEKTTGWGNWLLDTIPHSGTQACVICTMITSRFLFCGIGSPIYEMIFDNIEDKPLTTDQEKSHTHG